MCVCVCVCVCLCVLAGTVQADFTCKLVRDDLTVEQSTVVFRYINVHSKMIDIGRSSSRIYVLYWAK